MKLTSCENCGVVLDADNAPFPTESDMEADDYGHRTSSWNGEKYVSTMPCPACGEPICKPE